MSGSRGGPAPAFGQVVPPIDPRIRARRIAVRRVEGRRRLQRLVDAGLLLAVAAGFGIALRSPLLDVDEVAVAGATRTDPQRVADASGIRPGQALMDVDLRAAGRRVGQLPWVDEVRLHRGLDGTVVLEVTERRPVAVLDQPGGAVLVDLDGRALAPAGDHADLAGQLVHVTSTGPALVPGGTVPAATHDTLRLADGLAAAVPGAVQSLADTGELRGRLTQGGEVRFGDTVLLESKLRTLRTMLEQVDLRCLAVLDLRSPGSPVLTREPACS